MTLTLDFPPELEQYLFARSRAARGIGRGDDNPAVVEVIST